MNGIPAAADVLGQLHRILSYPGFAASNRLSEFLRFVVEQRLADRGHEVKECVIGVEVYGKGDAYDPRTDPTVRVDAGKLRSRLAKYYETDGRNDPLVITIPKGTYVPDFKVRNGPPKNTSLRFAAKVALASVLMLGGVLAAVGVLLKSSSSSIPGTRIVGLTSGLGEPSDPSFSPDGSMIAFSWNGESEDNFDIYVKVVDAPSATRLTTDPARDSAPAWSPDGRRIAFLRNPGPLGEIYVIAALGGSEQRIAPSSGQSVGWSADSRSLLVMDRKASGEPFSGFLVSLESGGRKQLTFPPHESFFGDYDFVTSPDGTTIAFSRQMRPPVAELFLMPAAGGAAHKVAQSNKYLAGLAWTPDSREIVFSSRQSGVNALWRVNVKAPSTPVPIAGAETDVVHPSIPRLGSLERIAYQRVESSYRMWRASVSGDRISPPRCILPSRRFDSLPQISPDGQYLTFASDCSGGFAIWVSRLDGSDLRNLTAGSGLSCGSPRWSPDGTMIAFDAHGDGESSDIYSISASSGPLRQLTREPSMEVRPSWSQDGRWIYFCSDRSGEQEIWKMDSAGTGNAAQVTRAGGFEGFESMDGSVLYFVKRGSGSSALWQIASGGKESLVSNGVRDGRWSVTRAGIFFIDALRRVCRLDADGRSACIGTVAREGTDSAGLTMSRDGKEMVYVQPEPSRSELRMAQGRLF